MRERWGIEGLGSLVGSTACALVKRLNQALAAKVVSVLRHRKSAA